MPIETFFLILLALVVSVAVVWFQYSHKQQQKGTLYWFLRGLRFVAIFGVLLLLINPKLTKTALFTEKPNLIVLQDNSASITELDAASEITSLIDQVDQNTELEARFNLRKHSFGTGLNTNTNLTFDESNSNIAKALTSVASIYGNTPSVILLITDGNQTIGNDYVFLADQIKHPIFPIAVGDTTRYQDLKIDRINSNSFAFLKNSFPIEIFASYEGTGAVNAQLSIIMDGKVVFTKVLPFSATQNSQYLTTLLHASTVGVKNITVKLQPFANEKNTQNNQRQLAVEVIDEKTKIALVSEVMHPDVGALKKSIESNEQRTVTLVKPSVALAEIEDADVFLLYQPNAAFAPIYDFMAKKKANAFTITGTKTDWNFLNAIQTGFTVESYGQKEEVSAVKNAAFSYFDVSDFSLDGFPPLEGILGEIVLTGKNDAILTQRIKGVDLNTPLLSIITEDPVRNAVLFGENIWKWRMQSYRNDQHFKNFDDFIGKIMLNLSMTPTKNRFNLEYSPIYQRSSEAVLKATYFDETYIFDTTVNITIKVVHKDTGSSMEIPLLLKGNYYEADLSNLPAGSYEFVATVSETNMSKSGSFIIQDFDIEKQFLSANYQKLQTLANNSNGKLYFSSEGSTLLQSLITDPQWAPIQRSEQNVVSLIDFRWLLALIVIAFASEWFIRKYNGLI
ncbi:vWA domain-containing protein [Arenibacter sp. GZD96]|uniref:vWA domain-containing protein n=1 Tax=Aurantibrevibacter litoralis TaxID=3106030 RepID=UPI002AFF2F12|nr:vWA domain-containing protein [Arenibacter sp. GZD-96]MEA1785298.1 vWA domain-containing protein [Arenibacter sp. GZD-96]